MNVPWMVLYQLCYFGAEWNFKMATMAETVYYGTLRKIIKVIVEPVGLP